MQKPVLVIMAAGMGSRFGGLKQIAPMDQWGNKLIDFSIYDAIRAGFEEAIFIIKHEIEADFNEAITEGLKHRIRVSYAYQELTDVPKGVAIPVDRIKPLGTTQAILCAKDQVANRPFAVINADDYYGPEAFSLLYDFLTTDRKRNEHALIGYKIENTLTDHGFVSRGVCVVNREGELTEIKERKQIVKTEECAAYTEDGISFIPITRGTTVSMNCFAFSPGMMDYLKEHFTANIEQGLAESPYKYEDLLPNAVCASLANGHRVKVIPTRDEWFGVTYQEDRPKVMEGIRRLKELGVYSERLW